MGGGLFARLLRSQEMPGVRRRYRPDNEVCVCSRRSINLSISDKTIRKRKILLPRAVIEQI